MGLGHIAGLGEQQRHRVLGGGDDVGLRGVDHHHAAARRCFDVDVVQPDTGPTDHDEIGGDLEEFGRDLGGRPDDQCVCADDVGTELGEIELHIDGVPGGAEAIKASLGDFFGHQDAGHGFILI